MAKPITIDGVRYESQAAAARALGVNTSAISRRASPERKAVRNAEARAYYWKKRPIKITVSDQETKETMGRMLRHFPQCETFDALVFYAVQRLAATTDD